MDSKDDSSKLTSFILLLSCGEQLQKHETKESPQNEESSAQAETPTVSNEPEEISKQAIERPKPKDPDFHHGCNYSLDTPCPEQQSTRNLTLSRNSITSNDLAYLSVLSHPHEINTCLQQHFTADEKMEFEQNLQIASTLLTNHANFTRTSYPIPHDYEQNEKWEKYNSEIDQFHLNHNKQIYPYMCYFEKVRRKYCNEVKLIFDWRIDRLEKWDDDDWLAQPSPYTEGRIALTIEVLTEYGVPLIFAYYGVKC